LREDKTIPRQIWKKKRTAKDSGGAGGKLASKKETNHNIIIRKSKNCWPLREHEGLKAREKMEKRRTEDWEPD